MATCAISAATSNLPPINAIPLPVENSLPVEIPRDDSERSLIQRAQRGDEQAFWRTLPDA